MKKTILVLFVLFLPILSWSATKNLEYSVWIPYWKKTVAVPETQANIKKLKTISPFSYEVNADGTIKDTMKVGVEPWVSLIATAKINKVKIIPTIAWFDGASILKVLSKKTTRDAHIKAISKIVNTNNFAGIDIDYENKKVESFTNFGVFLRDLSKELKKTKKTLVCTIEPRLPPTSRFLVVPEEIEYANDYKKINQYCDEVRIMAYDQMTIDIKLNKTKRLGGYYAPVADVDFVKKVATYSGINISRSKIVLGVANYGYEYEVTDKRTFYDYTKLRSLSYKGAMDLAKSVGATPTRNNAGELSFTYVKDGKTRLVWFSDSVAIAQKVALAKQYNLKGVALFRVDGESEANLWSVFK